jgi:hypothetical protein
MSIPQPGKELARLCCEMRVFFVLQICRPGSPVPGGPVPGSPVPGSPVPGSPVPRSPVSGVLLWKALSP